MVNDRISSLRTSSSNAADGAGKSTVSTSAQSASNESQSSDFGAILGKANTQKQPVAKSQVRPSVAKLDKPKVGSRDPFFPATPAPYHPDANTTQAQAPKTGEGVESIPTDEVRSKSDVSISRAKLDRQVPASGIRQPSDARAGVSRQSVDDDLDDEDGVMSNSYEGAAVSYPVSRIAHESLDDDTKEDLQAQGLWNLPTMVVAQPTAKMAAMRESSVPVQKPITQFMASLENDLGVSPDRLVQAFQKLPAGQLALPPEQTMVQVIKNLDLNKDEATTAMQAYSKMLAQMQMLDKPERLQAAPLMMGGLTTSKVEQQLELANLVKPEAKSVAGKYAMQLPEGMVKAGAGDTAKYDGKSEFMQSMQKAEGVPVGRSENQGYEALKNSQGNSSSFGDQIGMPNAEVKGQLQNNFAGSDQSANQNFGDQSQPQGGAGAAMSAMASSNEGKANQVKDQVNFEAKRDAGVKAVSVKGNAVSGMSDSVNLNSSAQVPPDLKPLQNVGAPATTAGATGAAAELKNENQARHDAIQHIVSNAQLLAQKGGGEMKLTLKPDHMGEIQLRVAMEGNKVNVQMTAEKSEVKKLIEQSVHELRSGLAQHNFSMEKLDVSLTQKDSGNQFQGKQPDFGAAQDFFNQFHQQQSNRRQMLAGMAELSNPTGRKSSATGGMNANSIAGSFSGGNGMRTMGSSRLNVVA